MIFFVIANDPAQEDFQGKSFLIFVWLVCFVG
jgi:hypothetical protein